MIPFSLIIGFSQDAIDMKIMGIWIQPSQPGFIPICPAVKVLTAFIDNLFYSGIFLEGPPFMKYSSSQNCFFRENILQQLQRG